MAIVIRTEFVDKIPDLNDMLGSDDFGITAESIINIQWNYKIQMYCIYWKDNGGKGFTYQDGYNVGYEKGYKDALRNQLISLEGGGE